MAPPPLTRNKVGMALLFLLSCFFDDDDVVVFFSWRAAMQVPRCYISYELITKSVPLPPPFFPTPEREGGREREGELEI